MGMTELNTVPGWENVIDWFGYAPSFHDSEVVAIDLRRDPEPSTVCIHAWRTNRDLTETGHFRQDGHALVTFKLHGIKALKLEGWGQNVLSELSVDRTDEGYILRLPEIFGVDGEISATQIEITVEPFEPKD